MRIAGGTKDISAGQLLDRFGVAMGMPFPAGPYLDDLAYEELEKLDFDVRALKRTGVIPKLRIDEGFFNLSGAETRLMRYAADPGDIPAGPVTAELFASLAGLLISDAHCLSDRFGTEVTYMAGGVASRRTVSALVNKKADGSIRFGDPALSGDNAVGTALLAKRKYETGKRITGK